MIYRALTICTLLFASSLIMYGYEMDARTEIKRSLGEFPMKIEDWEARGEKQFQDNIVKSLGADEYILRNYYNSKGGIINIYISYYSYIGQTKGYHSPLNCMPGSGWNIGESRDVRLALLEEGRMATVRQLVLHKGSQRRIALYWYQARGRVICSDYWERIYRVLDSLWIGRTDGAFVRIMLEEEGEHPPLFLLKQFAPNVVLSLKEFLPE